MRILTIVLKSGAKLEFEMPVSYDPADLMNFQCRWFATIESPYYRVQGCTGPVQIDVRTLAVVTCRKA